MNEIKAGSKWQNKMAPSLVVVVTAVVNERVFYTPTSSRSRTISLPVGLFLDMYQPKEA